MTEFKIQKLDARYTGYKHFKYRVRLSNRSHLKRLASYIELRNWCVNTWGMSCEKEVYISDAEFDRNGHWAWGLAGNNAVWDDIFVYLVGPEDLMLFELRWM